MSSVSATVKPYKGIGMEGLIARWYASNTRKDLPEYAALARNLASRLAPKSSVLEVAPGPGYASIELAKLGDLRVTGLDISNTFLQIARKNAVAAGVNVDFRHGDAARMPLEDGSFDLLFCRAAFKNFAEPIAALQEMWRVLRPGGQAVIIDLRRDASRESIRRAVEAMHLGILNAMATRLIFRFALLRRAYTRSEFEQLFSQTNFCDVSVQENDIGLEIWAQK